MNLKKLLIQCHPDRHGGDHSRMEQYYAAQQRRRRTVREPKYCARCGTPVGGRSEHCQPCARARRYRKELLTCEPVIT